MVTRGEAGHRATRVAGAIQARVSEALLREVGDPALVGLVVTRVELSDDLGIAHVKVRLLAGGEELPRRRQALAGLRRAGGRLRTALSSALRMKRLPELRFAFDEGVDASLRVDELLAEIAAERGPEAPAPRGAGARPRRGG